MRRLNKITGLSTACVLIGLMGGCTLNGNGGESSITSARPEADVTRDAGRKPYAVLNFLGVQEGMTVLDVIAAGGYYTEVLSEAVGVGGRVYAQNTAGVLRFRDGRNDRALTDRLAGNRLPNVHRLDRETEDLGLLGDSVDVAITALNFHDIYHGNPVAAQAMLQAIKRVLKPGGVLGVIDHVGEPGAENAKLHRIDPNLVIAAAEQAGFTAQRSDLLANLEDDHTLTPFAPGIRGNTDRFLLKLTKQ